MTTNATEHGKSSGLETVLKHYPSRKNPLMRPVSDYQMVEAAIQPLESEKLVPGESLIKFKEEFACFCGNRRDRFLPDKAVDY